MTRTRKQVKATLQRNRDKIVLLYGMGYSTSQLARRFRVSGGSIWNVLNSAGVQMRSRPAEKKDRNELMRKRFLAGEKLADLAREYGVSPQRTSYLINRPLRRKA